MTRLMPLRLCYRLLFPLLLTGLSTCMPAWAADWPGVYSVLSQAEAAKLLGAPLATAYKSETKPTYENGNAHETNCGYFPKGYDYDKTEAPPPVGILIGFQTMRNDADARRMFEAGSRMGQSNSQMPGGAKFSVLNGMGDSAYLTLMSMPKLPHRANLTFLKSAVVVSVVVWKSADSVDEIARAAAKQVLTKLP